MTEEVVERLLRSLNREDQLLAIELISQNKDLKLDFLPWNNESITRAYPNRTKVKGYLPRGCFAFLIGSQTFTRIENSDNILQQYEIYNP